MKIYNPSGFSSKLTGSFSGSFVGDGSNITSISSDNIDFNFTAISSSAQIAEDISGSFTSVSSSLESRITDNEGSVSSLNSSTSSYLLNTTDTLTGDLTVTGTITAQEFHTEFVSASITYESGSHKFGDTSDDVHQFTGSVYIKGDTQLDGKTTLTDSGYFIGSSTYGFRFNSAADDSNNVIFYDNGTSYFSGSVGIGTSSPTDYLDIRPNDGVDTRYIRTHFTGSAAYNNASNNTEEKVASGLRFGWYSDYWQVGAARGGSTDIDGLIFSRNGTEVLVLHESGNVGIGTNNVTTKLTVKGSGTVAKFDSDQSYVDILLQNSSNTGYVNLDGNAMRFYVGGGTSSDIAMVMLNDGSIGIGTTSPYFSFEVDKAGSNAFDTIKGIGRFRNSSDSSKGIVLGYDTASQTGIIYPETDAPASNLAFYTYTGSAWGERMRIGSSGDVLIATNGKFLQGKRNTGSAVIDMIGFGAGTDTLQIKGGTSGGANAISFYDTGGFLGTFYNSNFGIGTTSPGRKLTVTGNTSGDANNLLLSNENDTDGDSASIGFSMLSNNTYVKSGIFFERTTTQGRGSLHLAINNEVNSNNVTKNDAKLTINNSGNVGIGSTSPAEKLHVESGNIRLKSNADGSTGLLRLYDAAGTEAGQIYPAGGDLKFYSPNDILFNQGGNVGIGMTSPQANLDVNADLRVNRYHKNVFNYYTVQSASNQYFHIKTGVGTNQTCMHMYHVEGYAYGQVDILDERFGFHTDSGGSIYGKSYKGTYANNIYKSSDSKVVIVFGPVNSYYMSFMVHLIESGMYSELFVKPTAATYSSSNSGAY